jgi:hypothetical protein
LQNQVSDRAVNNIKERKNVPNLILAIVDVVQDEMPMTAI